MASYSFPDDLVDLQSRLLQAWDDLEALGRTLPWSAVPMDGYTSKHRTIDPATGEPRFKEFPDSPGYSAEQLAERERLYALIATLTGQVRDHDWWDSLESGVVDARSALKATARGKAAAS